MERFHPYNLRNKDKNSAEMENNNSNPIPPPPPQPNPLPLPNRNAGIEETQRIFEQAEKIMKSLQTPQSITALQPFDGNPVKLHKFLRSVENLMPFLAPLKNTPFEKIWLQAIRSKIIDGADQVLETYGTPLDWNAIKANLIAYYNDKRDPVTLTRELFQLQQTTDIESFFGQVQNLLSLLINNTNISTNDENVKQDRIQTHKENALQVFLAGLKEPIGGNVRARQTANIKQAFDVAIEERNFQSRTGLVKPSLPAPARIHKSINFTPTPQFKQPMNFQFPPRDTPRFIPPVYPPRRPMPYFQHPQRPNIPRFNPPQNVASRPNQGALPAPEPMDVDRSIRSKFVNYVNRPQNSYKNLQKPNFSQNNRFTPAVPPRTARITELRNMEQYYEDPYGQNFYGENSNNGFDEDGSYHAFYTQTPNYESPSYYYPEASFDEYYPNYDYAPSHTDNSQEIAENNVKRDDRESIDNLNFQLEINPHPPK